jgi:beta-glucosidase
VEFAGDKLHGNICERQSGRIADKFSSRRRRYDKGWVTFAVPLNCLTNTASAQQFDSSRVNGLLIATDGQLEMSIADIRLALLPEGDQGCT